MTRRHFGDDARDDDGEDVGVRVGVVECQLMAALAATVEGEINSGSSSTALLISARPNSMPWRIFSARCNIYISRLCYDVSVRLSVRLSVTEVHWRITANLGFKFRSKFTVHCDRGEG